MGLGALVAITGFMRNHMGISGFIAMAAGVIVGNITVLEPLRYLIPVALFLMLYPSMLDVRPEWLAAVLTEPRLPFIALIMNFVISPVMIAGVSHLFRLHDTPAVLTGITLFGTLPCGGMIAAFTVILGGNVALTVLVTTLSYLLSLVMVPFWTKLLIGQVVPVSPLLILISRSISRFLNLSHSDSTAMVMSTTAKNNAVAMALALSAFGTDVGMVIAFTGPITQFPIMLTYLKIAQTRMERKT